MKDRLTPKAWPTNLRLKKREKQLEIEFDDGNRFCYSAEYLRVESPSAEVKGHGSSQRRVVPGCRDVAIVDVELIGNYAVRIKFDDSHDTGIYSWNYLYELGERQREIWHRYLEMLTSLGLSRDSR